MSEVKFHPIVWEKVDRKRHEEKAFCNGEQIGWIFDGFMKKKDVKYFKAGLVYLSVNINGTFPDVKSAKEAVEKEFYRFINQFVFIHKFIEK